MYQLTWELSDYELAEIYSDKKIKKAFKNMMQRNDTLLNFYVSDIYQSIIKQSSLSFLQHDLTIFEGDIISDFYKNIKFEILHKAIDMSLTAKRKNQFNVKKNIIEILHSLFILEHIMEDYLLERVYFLMKSKANSDQKLISKIDELDIFKKFTINKN